MAEVLVLTPFIAYIFLFSVYNRYTRVAIKHNIDTKLNLFVFWVLTLCCFIPLVNIILTILCVVDTFEKESDIVVVLLMRNEIDE